MNNFKQLKRVRIERENKDIQSAFKRGDINKKEGLFLTAKLKNIGKFSLNHCYFS